MTNRIALINDVHFGNRNDAKFLLDNQELFFRDYFFPELEKYNCKDIIIGGDVFDRRKYINFYTLAFSKRIFFDVAEKKNIHIKVFPGNHDCHYKSTNDLNSLNELLKQYKNITIYDEPTQVVYDGVSIDLIPWINNQNYSDTINFIKQSKSEFCYGHFSFKGFEMYKGIENDDGMSITEFQKYKEVWSGHFHQKSKKHNINYLGAPMEFTFADCGEDRGFHFFDTKTKSVEFKKNPFTLFEKIYYNDESSDAQTDYKNTDFSKYKNKIVKIFVVKKKFPALFEHYIDQMVDVEGIAMTIQEDYSEFHSDNIENIEKVSTKELMEKYVDDVETDMDKIRLKSILNNTYIEALHEDLA
jgi:DNA repair exonuclease SbcCD nuclease subunit